MLKSAYEGLNTRPKVYLSKEYFCEMYPTCVSSKLCEFIHLEKICAKCRSATLFFEFFDLSDLYIFEHLSLHIHFRAFKPSYTFSWVRRVLPETKFENKWTQFFELFDLSDHYIFEYLSLHIRFRAFKPSYVFSSI